MKINVTQDHIKNGVRCSTTNCPMAIAIKETLNINNVSVGPGGITINGKVTRFTEETLNFLEDFDKGYPTAKPFTFEVRT